MTLSSWLQQIRQDLIVSPITKDPRETRVPETRLGLSVSWLFSNAVGGGQASFDEPIGSLSARDRVMLYALLLQKGHLLELSHAFAKLLDRTSLLNGATVLDIGCGPFTAGLALANVTGNEPAFRYFGIDTSRAMCALGVELADAARTAGGLAAQTTVTFCSSLSQINFGQLRGGWTVVILSYLLASPSINVESLVQELVGAFDRIGPGPIALLYTNAARAEARAAYPEFEARLKSVGFEKQVEELESLDVGARPRNIHYALFTKLSPTPIPLNAYKL